MARNPRIWTLLCALTPLTVLAVFAVFPPSPNPSSSRSSRPRAVIDHTSVPHILDLILANCDREALLAFRSTGSAIKARADTHLAFHLVLRGTNTLVTTTHGGGRLPLLTPASVRTQSLEAPSVPQSEFTKRHVTPRELLVSPNEAATSDGALHTMHAHLVQVARTVQPQSCAGHAFDEPSVPVSDEMYHVLGAAHVVDIDGIFTEHQDLVINETIRPAVLRFLFKSLGSKETIHVAAPLVVTFIQLVLVDDTFNWNLRCGVERPHLYLRVRDGTRRAVFTINVASHSLGLDLGPLEHATVECDMPPSVTHAVFIFSHTPMLGDTVSVYGSSSHHSVVGPPLEPRTLGMLHDLVVQIARHPDVSFALVGVEHIPRAALCLAPGPVHNMPPVPAAQAAAAARIQVQVVRRAVNHLIVQSAEKDLGMHVSPEAAGAHVSVLTTEQYRALVGDAQFALETDAGMSNA